MSFLDKHPSPAPLLHLRIGDQEPEKKKRLIIVSHYLPYQVVLSGETEPLSSLPKPRSANSQSPLYLADHSPTDGLDLKLKDSTGYDGSELSDSTYPFSSSSLPSTSLPELKKQGASHAQGLKPNRLGHYASAATSGLTPGPAWPSSDELFSPDSAASSSLLFYSELSESMISPIESDSMSTTSSMDHLAFPHHLGRHDPMPPHYYRPLNSFKVEAARNVDPTKASYSIKPNHSGNVSLFNAIHAARDPRTGSISNSFVEAEPIYVGVLNGLNKSVSANTEAVFKSLENDYGCYPICLSDDERERHYKRFCKQTLWPIFHYLQLDYTIGRRQNDLDWQAYKNVNEAFAKVILEQYQPGDMIWINDYHLLLLPGLLREKLPKAMIGFFLHIPFPSSEVFRSLYVRSEVLEGILASDLVGFQTYSYARSFLQTCSRILGYELLAGGIALKERIVNYGVFPISIHASALRKRRESAEVLDMITTLRQRYAGVRIIIGRDKLDPIKGLRQKLLAFEHFLSKWPEWVGRIILIQVALSTVHQPDLFSQVSAIVSRINSRYGSLNYTPVVFLHQDISFTHYLSLLSIADICMIASLRDGMNLTSHEYVVCQEGRYGVLILSEFAGASHSFGSALRMNPWHVSAAAATIHQALNMPEAERRSRHAALDFYVNHHGASDWVHDFTDDLVRSYERHSKHMSPMTFSHQNILQSYASSSHDRLVVFDSEALSFLRAHGAVLRGILRQLKRLTMDKGTLVLFHLEESKKEIEDHYRYLKHFFVSAENGAFLSVPLPDQDDWQFFPILHTKSPSPWRNKVREILEYYTERTLGSFIVENESFFTWDYHLSDLSFGSWQSKECQTHIQDALGTIFPIHVIVKPNCQLQIRPIDAQFSNAWRYFSAQHSIDFVLLIGHGHECEPHRYFLHSFTSASVTSHSRSTPTMALANLSFNNSGSSSQGACGSDELCSSPAASSGYEAVLEQDALFYYDLSQSKNGRQLDQLFAALQS